MTAIRQAPRPAVEVITQPTRRELEEFFAGDVMTARELFYDEQLRLAQGLVEQPEYFPLSRRAALLRRHR